MVNHHERRSIIFPVCFLVCCLFCLQLLGHPFPAFLDNCSPGSLKQLYSQPALWVPGQQTWKSLTLSCFDVFNEEIHYEWPDWEAYGALVLSFLCDVWTGYLLKVIRVLNALRIVQTRRNTQSQMWKVLLSIKHQTNNRKEGLRIPHREDSIYFAGSPDS